VGREWFSIGTECIGRNAFDIGEGVGYEYFISTISWQMGEISLFGPEKEPYGVNKFNL